MAERLTDALVRRLPLPTPPRAHIIHADVLPGFGCRCTVHGRRTFVLRYRVRSSGIERTYSIGSFPSWSTAQARAEAMRLKRIVDTGGDPQGDVFEARDAPTVADLSAKYIDEHLPRKRPTSQREDKSLIRIWLLPELGDRRVADIKPRDVTSLHRRISETAPIRANRAISLLSTMMGMAIRLEWRPDNPCRGVTKNPEVRRERFLSTDELGRLTAVLATYPKRDVAIAIMLLMLTGARRNELLGATWGEVDLEAGTWTRPPERMKGKRAHTVPLSAPAKALLVELQNLWPTKGFLFPGPGRAGRLVDIKRDWHRVRELAGLGPCRLHDLRHSFASFAVSHGLSLPTIGALLAHRSPATTARYAHLHDTAARSAAETVGQIVVPLRRQAPR